MANKWHTMTGLSLKEAGDYEGEVVILPAALAQSFGELLRALLPYKVDEDAGPLATLDRLIKSAVTAPLRGPRADDEERGIDPVAAVERVRGDLGAAIRDLTQRVAALSLIVEDLKKEAADHGHSL